MDINTIEPEVVKTGYTALLGEGPVWDENEQRLYWVDILNGRLLTHNPASEEHDSHELGEHLGAAALREKGGLVLALKSGFAFYDISSRQIIPAGRPESHPEGNRFNDGKCDPGGRFWAGTMAYDLEKGAGTLYSLNPDMSIHTKIRGVTISNGMAWNTDEGLFYYIDSPEREICAFDYEPETGEISNRRVIRKMEEKDGLPDGMTIDTDNKLWVAMYDGGKVIRLDPATGDTLSAITLPVPKVTSCTFGGTELSELYITTAREHMTEDDLGKAPLSGSLFRAKLPVTGKPPHRFSG